MSAINSVNMSTQTYDDNMISTQTDTWTIVTGTEDYGDITATDSIEHSGIIAEDKLQIIYMLIGILGILDNALVAVVILSFKAMRQRLANMFILSQTMADFTASIFLVLTTVFQDTGIALHGLSGELYCRLWLNKLPLWGMLVSSTYSLVVLTIERWFSVVHPIRHKTTFNRRKAGIFISVAWLIGPLYNAAYMIPSSGVVDGNCFVFAFWPNTSVQTGVGILTIFIQYFLPLIILCYCYIHMAIVLKQRVRATEVQGTHDPKTKKDNNMQRIRRNIIKTLTLISLCFVLCWTWNQIYFLIFNLGASVDFTNGFYHFTVIAVFCNCCINAFVYMLKYEQFQISLRKLFRIPNKVDPDRSLTESTINE